LNRSVQIALTALTLFLAAPASAHEFWLAPSTYRASTRDTVEIAAFVGTGFRGERKPYATSRTLRFTMIGPKSIDLTPAAMNGDLAFTRFIPADDGGCVVAYHSSFASIELPADEFDAYLRLEGLTEPLKARSKLGQKAGPGRERYARCPKTWIAGRDPGRLLKPVGLPLEIVPLGDPEASTPLRVKVLFHNHPLAGALVRGWNQRLAHGTVPTDAAARDSVGPVAGSRTGADGIATLTLDRPGEWMLSAVHMIPSADRKEADWESLWASLTFIRSR